MANSKKPRNADHARRVNVPGPQDDPDIYEILVESALDVAWSDWFNGVSVTTLENGKTRLSDVIPDQAALHGLLARIRDLNLKLISIKKKSG